MIAKLGMALTFVLLGVLFIPQVLAADEQTEFTMIIVNSTTRFDVGNDVYFRVTGLNSSTAYILIMDRNRENVYGLIYVPPFKEEPQTIKWTVALGTPSGIYTAIYRNYLEKPESTADFTVKSYDPVGIALSNDSSEADNIAVAIQQLKPDTLMTAYAMITMVGVAMFIRFSGPIWNKQIQHKDEAEKASRSLIARYAHMEFRKVDPAYLAKMEQTTDAEVPPPKKKTKKLTVTNGPIIKPDELDVSGIKTFSDALAKAKGDYEKAAMYLTEAKKRRQK